MSATSARMFRSVTGLLLFYSDTPLYLGIFAIAMFSMLGHRGTIALGALYSESISLAL